MIAFPPIRFKITKEGSSLIVANNTVFALVRRKMRQQIPDIFEKNNVDLHSRCVFGASSYQRTKLPIDAK